MSEDKLTRSLRRHHRERVIERRKTYLPKDWNKEFGRLANGGVARPRKKRVKGDSCEREILL